MLLVFLETLGSKEYVPPPKKHSKQKITQRRPTYPKVHAKAEVVRKPGRGPKQKKNPKNVNSAAKPKQTKISKNVKDLPEADDRFSLENQRKAIERVQMREARQEKALTEFKAQLVVSCAGGHKFGRTYVRI